MIKKIIEKKDKLKKVKTVKKAEKAKKAEPETFKKTVVQSKPTKYIEAIGRRKTAVARVRIFTQEKQGFFINQKPLEVYFPIFELQQIVKDALVKMNYLDQFKVSVVVRGGGYHAQAEAIRHGLARALVLFNVNFRKRLKKAGYLKRDDRMRERKKFGLKRARRAPQWSKR